MTATLRKFFAAFAAMSLCFSVIYAQESSDDDSFDDLFENAEDSEEAVKSEIKTAGVDTTLNIASLSIPLKVSGKLNTEFGGAYINDDGENSGSAYFDLVNYIYFTTRPDKYMALKGSIKTTMPKTEEADNDEQNHYFYLYEFYFDYIFLNKLYITAGKKKTTWGNIRLFSNDDDFDGDEDALFTNAMYDSRYNISGIVRVPFGNANLNLLTMYRGHLDEPSAKEMSYAGSFDFIIGNTSFNFFGRSFPYHKGKLGDTLKEKTQYRHPIVGGEIKRTILGFDFYAQGIGRLETYKALDILYTLKRNERINDLKDQCAILGMDFNDVLKENFSYFYDNKYYEKERPHKRDIFSKIILTGGFYRLWNETTPYVGINAEYQAVFFTHDNLSWKTKNGDFFTSVVDEYQIDENSYTFLKNSKNSLIQRFIIDFGFAKLGKSKNIKAGIQWYHSFMPVYDESDKSSRQMIKSYLISGQPGPQGLSTEVINGSKLNKYYISGYIKPALIISNVFPHVDWKNGVKWEYGTGRGIGKITFGTYFSFSLGY